MATVIVSRQRRCRRAARSSVGGDEEADANASGFDVRRPMGGEGAGPVSVPELEAVYFDYDRSTIREDQRATLRGNAQKINSHSEWATVVVEGHCDERGSEEYNLALGERRANAVKRYLVDLGVPSRKLRHGELRREQARRCRATTSRPGAATAAPSSQVDQAAASSEPATSAASRRAAARHASRQPVAVGFAPPRRAR